METQYIDQFGVAFDLIREDDIWAIRDVGFPSGVTELRVPATVEYLPVGRIARGHSPFRGKQNLRKVVLPQGSRYGVSAGEFAGCVNLNCFDVCAGHPYHSSNDGMLFDTSGKVLVAMPSAHGMIALPAVERIQDCAFQDCRGLQGVDFTDRLEKIGSNAFEKWSSLQKIVIPRGVRELGNRVFCGCTTLRDIELPDGCQFGFEMFKNCAPTMNIIVHGKKHIDTNGCFGSVTVTYV